MATDLLKIYYLSGMIFTSIVAIFILLRFWRCSAWWTKRFIIAIVSVLILGYEIWREIHVPINAATLPTSPTRYFMIRGEDWILAWFWFGVIEYDTKLIWEKLTAFCRR